jgi:diaminopimelate epimerase
VRYAKGHGTGNDFIILPDAGDPPELTAELVRRLCDRRTGIGADGVLRVVRAEPGTAAEWFMDYRNADGSVAEMCGNGIRVFAAYLIGHQLAAGPEVAIGTRSGTRVVRQAADGMFTVEMGPARTGGPTWAVVGGQRHDGIAVDVGNPHVACLVDRPVSGFDLSGRPEPEVDAARFPDGANVELVRVTGDHAVEMRVHERGSGETLSCGTGAVAAVAAAVAAAESVGEWPDRGTQPWRVDVPGGQLEVMADPAASVLTGPAVLVAEGDICPGWLSGRPTRRS